MSIILLQYPDILHGLNIEKLYLAPANAANS